MSGVSLKNRAVDMGRALADRVAWRVRGQRVRLFAAPATMARTFTYLFGIGATLLLVTLPLYHSADRNTAALIAVALVAYLAAGGFLILFDRLPLWAFEASPLCRHGSGQPGGLLRRLRGSRGLRHVLLLGRGLPRATS